MQSLNCYPAQPPLSIGIEHFVAVGGMGVRVGTAVVGTGVMGVLVGMAVGGLGVAVGVTGVLVFVGVLTVGCGFMVGFRYFV